MGATAETAAQTKSVSAAQSKEMIARINKSTARLQTLQCTFEQVKSLSFLQEKMTSRGTMHYEQGPKLRWEYTQPTPYTFIINGGKAQIRSGSGSNTIDLQSSRRFQAIARIMMQSVTGQSLASGSDFGVQMLSGDGEWVAVLTPKKKDIAKIFSQVRLHFDSQKQTLRRVEMKEKNGDETVITFQNVKKNQPIDAKVFAIH